MKFFVNGWDPKGFPLDENTKIQVMVSTTPMEKLNPFEVIEYSAFKNAVELIKHLEFTLNGTTWQAPAKIEAALDLIKKWKQDAK